MNYASQLAPQQAPMSGVGYAGDATARQLEVPEAAARLDKQIHILADAVDVLNSRLTGTVARSPVPVNETKGGDRIKAVMQCGLGSLLDTAGDRAQQIGDRVRDLIDRLEV